MRILALNIRSTTEAPVAFQFDTPKQVEFAWNWIVVKDRLADFSYRPSSEGVNEDRAMLSSYLSTFRTTGVFVPLETATIVRLVENFWGADLNRTLYPLIIETDDAKEDSS